MCVSRIRIDMNNSWYKFTRYVPSILNYTVYIFAILQDKLKMYETSNVLNRSLCRIILEEKISRAFKMLQNFFDDWRKIEDNIFMWRKSFSNHSQSSTFDMYPSIMQVCCLLLKEDNQHTTHQFIKTAKLSQAKVRQNKFKFMHVSFKSASLYCKIG